MSTSPTAGAILAGGTARRFGGQDKGRLIVNGRAIVEHQINLLRAITSDVFLVGHDPDRFTDLSLPVHADVLPGSGAIGGILTALESTTADRVLVVAWDMPFLVEGLLRTLLARANDAPHGAWITTTRGPEPLAACYRQAARIPIKKAILSGHLKAVELDQRLELAVVTEEEVERFGPVDRLLANLNTPDDYARVQ